MDYLSKYSNKVTKFQEGGAMAPAQQGAPAAPQGGGDPAAELQGMVAQYAQSKDPQLAVAIADMLVAMMGGGAVPSQRKGGRMEAKPAPVFRKGGKLVG